MNYKLRFRDLALLAVLRPDRLAAIVFWRLVGKRLRARYRLRDAIAALPFAYERRLEAEGQADLARVKHCNPSRFCVHIHVPSGMEEDARQAIASALGQSLKPHGGIIVTHEGGPMPVFAKEQVLYATSENPMHGLRLALKEASGRGIDYCVPLSPQHILPRHALIGYAAHSCQVSGPHEVMPVLYADQDEARTSFDRTSSDGNPWLKPKWDARMILSQDYVSAACALPVTPALEHLDSDASAQVTSVFGLMLQMSRGETRVPMEHVPRTAVRTPVDSWRAKGTSIVDALQDHCGDDCTVAAGAFGTAKLTWPEPEPLPLISIVIATRDKVELLRTCVDGLLNKTDYPALEIIIADNDSKDAEALSYLDTVTDDPRVTVVRWPHAFNYSAINNFAARHATGDYLCLLNNDIEILHSDWLRAMLREAARPGVGAVGARLLYPDRSIQHAGVVIGMGNAAGHAHRALPEGEPGYFAQAQIARGASAVTAACLLVQKRHFDAVGGLDEEHLAVAYNDIDFCLKLRQRGLANIYTPAATLIHHESKSRGLDFSAEHLQRYLRELAVFQERWATETVTDPWHHPQLDRASETYVPQSIA